MEHTRLVQRLVELRAELESGQQVMAELDSKRATLTTPSSASPAPSKYWRNCAIKRNEPEATVPSP